ncbi:unnamed protein product [Chondrus crispus]|uniref:Uncharacterized protein n=1 Tax=Chondrus crispus TaxID=2769 RepID=R7QHN3_CHOCR|nr:unnamed protein product [Chondrus crispus]CDF38007.1 unnamed protein product [Chondrus crispus]|eukprot:XP_005717876.1 unnamed protein product [Chondrus crispus]
MGLEIHFIQPTPGARSRRQLVPVLLNEKAIDPRSDHLSFLCQWHKIPSRSDWHLVIETLDRHGVEYLERTFPEDDLRQPCNHLPCFLRNDPAENRFLLRFNALCSHGAHGSDHNFALSCLFLLSLYRHSSSSVIPQVVFSLR